MSRSYKQPYTRSKRFDSTCRCHGTCEYCRDNRLYQSNKQPTLEEELKIEDYNMIQPESKLPWEYTKISDEYIVKDAEGLAIMCDRQYENWAPYEEDAKYLVVACNQYPVLLDTLERLESTTTDKVTAAKIREVLIEQGLWK